MTKQRFAWLPTKVWNMRNKKYKFDYIWLAWYYEDTTVHTCTFFKLTDTSDPEVSLQAHNKFITRNNIW